MEQLLIYGLTGALVAVIIICCKAVKKFMNARFPGQKFLTRIAMIFAAMLCVVAMAMMMSAIQIWFY